MLRAAVFRLLRGLISLFRPPSAALELAALVLLWLLYLALAVPIPASGRFGGLDVSGVVQAWFDPGFRQPGIEHERLAGTLLPVEIGLKRYGHIPTWNPYLNGGQPVINNAFSYLFNPVYSLPVLLLGGVQGSKLATALALLVAAVSMWALARAVGTGGVGRVTAGALYMGSGGLAAKFYTGHFQLGLSLAWLPLVFAGLWWTLRRRDRRAPAVVLAVAFALLFTSGNIYYTLHALVGCTVILAAHLLEREAGRWAVQWWRLRRVVISAAFAVGLSALAFLPVLATARFIIHEGDRDLLNRYSLAQAAINLIYPWEQWQPLFDEVPPSNMFVVVDYNHIGLAPFVLIACGGLLAARRIRAARITWIALLLALVMMVWGAGQTAVVQTLYASSDLLAQFRYVGRALAVAALWWILLAGLAIDRLWSALRTAPDWNAYDRTRLVRALTAGVLVWLYGLFYSLAPASGRLALALGSLPLRARLDDLRFTTLAEVTDGLWVCLLAAVALDTLLLAAAWLFRWTPARRHGWRGFATRGLRLIVLFAACISIGDVLATNSSLLPLSPSLGSFTALYDYMHQAEPDTPFPMLQEPHVPMAFDAYYAEVRNWGLSEGWHPGAITGIIPAHIMELPRWAIVSNVYGGGSRAFAEEFVQTLGYQLRYCATLAPQPPGINPCAVEAEIPYTAVLYEQPDALPYAFLVPAETLMIAPDTLTYDTVQPVSLISHQQDTITLVAEHPADDRDYYLAVRETHFPGWLAFADGLPVDSVTLAPDTGGGYSEGFIGVRLLPGQHTYTLRFQPPGLAAGLVMFLVTLVVIAFYLLPYPHKKSQPENPAGSSMNDYRRMTTD